MFFCLLATGINIGCAKIIAVWRGNKSRKSFFLLPTFLAGLLSVALGGCRNEPTPVSKDRFLLDTLVTIKSYDQLGENRVEAGIEDAFRRMSVTERRLNAHDPKSETAVINGLAGQDKYSPVSPDFSAAASEARRVHTLTGGRFDITIGPVVEVWGFGKKPAVPSRTRLKKAVSRVGFDRFILSSRGARLTAPGMRLDLGGVTKGVAVDRAAALLERRGLKHALITTVSSTKATGPKPGGRPWLIGVQSPRPRTAPGLIGTVELKRGSVSTSGDYHQYFMKNGRRYHHILDPKTGRPAAGFRSVTVITTRGAAFADALSTGLAVMGRRPAMALVEKLPDVEAIFIDGRGRVWPSTGLMGKLQIP